MTNSTINLASKPGIKENKENVKHPFSDSGFSMTGHATWTKSKPEALEFPHHYFTFLALSLGLLSLLLESATESVSNSLTTISF